MVMQVDGFAECIGEDQVFEFFRSVKEGDFVGGRVEVSERFFARVNSLRSLCAMQVIAKDLKI